MYVHVQCTTHTVHVLYKYMYMHTFIHDYMYMYAAKYIVRLGPFTRNLQISEL